MENFNVWKDREKGEKSAEKGIENEIVLCSIKTFALKFMFLVSSNYIFDLFLGWRNKILQMKSFLC